MTLIAPIAQLLGESPGIAALREQATRPFGSAAQMAEEQREVRVWGGIHYRNSLVVSDEMGRKITAYLVANTMKPVR